MIKQYNHKALRQVQQSADGKIITCDFHNMLTGVRKQKSFHNLTIEQVDKWVNGEMIQTVMGHLPPADRELFLTGMDDDEWQEI